MLTISKEAFDIFVPRREKRAFLDNSNWKQAQCQLSWNGFCSSQKSNNVPLLSSTMRSFFFFFQSWTFLFWHVEEYFTPKSFSHTCVCTNYLFDVILVYNNDSVEFCIKQNLVLMMDIFCMKGFTGEKLARSLSVNFHEKCS